MYKRYSHIFIVAAAALICLSTMSWAVPPHGVKYTPHNLGTTGLGRMSNIPGTTETEICIYCHTPHNAVAGKGFLWNRIPEAGVSATTFALYTGSPTLNISQADKAAGISEISKMCMTCHDGATAINSMANARAGTVAAQMGEYWQTGTFIDEWGKNIGEYGPDAGWGSGVAGQANLTNDHPISFNYETVQANDLTIRDISVPKGEGLVFWGAGGNMLECVTCHDPHINYGKWDWRQSDLHLLGNYDPSLAPFLRRSNSSSKLCFSCHDK